MEEKVMSEWIKGNDIKLGKNYWVVLKSSNVQDGYGLMLWTSYLPNAEFIIRKGKVIAYKEVDFTEVATDAAVSLNIPVTFERPDGKFSVVKCCDDSSIS